MNGAYNPGTDPTSRQVYEVILNGINRGQTSGWWLPQAMREHFARAVFAELCDRRVEVRLPDAQPIHRRGRRVRWGA